MKIARFTFRVLMNVLILPIAMVIGAIESLEDAGNKILNDIEATFRKDA